MATRRLIWYNPYKESDFHDRYVKEKKNRRDDERTFGMRPSTGAHGSIRSACPIPVRHQTVYAGETRQDRQKPLVNATMHTFGNIEEERRQGMQFPGLVLWGGVFRLLSFGGDQFALSIGGDHILFTTVGLSYRCAAILQQDVVSVF